MAHTWTIRVNWRLLIEHPTDRDRVVYKEGKMDLWVLVRGLDLFDKHSIVVEAKHQPPGK